MHRTNFLATTSAGLAGVLLPSAAAGAEARAATPAPAGDRAAEVYERRLHIAATDRARFTPSPANGDERRYAAAGYLANFSKGLPHGPDGMVDRAAYDAFVRAIERRDVALLDPRTAAPLRFLVGRSQTTDTCVAGCDPLGIPLPPPPVLTSAEQAREAIELGWLALTRDVPFAAYESDPAIARACADLHETPATVFRPRTMPPGPPISQFLFVDVIHPVLGPLSQRQEYPVAGRDFLVARDELAAVRNGITPTSKVIRGTPKRYIANGRDYADFVYRDGSCFDNAVWFVEALPRPAHAATPFHFDLRGLMGLAFAPTWIATFYQKFAVHRRLRPEEFFGLIGAPDGVRFDASLERAAMLPALQSRFGGVLLPQTHEAGSPFHPAYPAAHSTLAGLSATILKAFVNADTPWPNPVVPNADGTRLEPYRGTAPLTVGSEIDRLAMNFAYGRHHAGVHYRSDSDAGLRLGEAAALNLLRDTMALCSPSTPPLHVTTFDGARVTIAVS